MFRLLLLCIVPAIVWIILISWYSSSLSLAETEKGTLMKSLSEIQSTTVGLKVTLKTCQIDLKNSLKREKSSSESVGTVEKNDKLIELEKQLEIKSSHNAQLMEKLKMQVGLVEKYKLALQEIRDSGSGNKHSFLSLDNNSSKSAAAEEDSTYEIELEIESVLEVLKEGKRRIHG